MSKEKYLEYLQDKFKISKYVLERYINSVGINEKDIENYARNNSCAFARKLNGFNVYYTAIMFTEKNEQIDKLTHENEQLKQQLTEKEKELEIYKRALELASKSVQYANYCKIDDNYVDFESDFITQAREKIEKEKKDG